MVNKIIPVVFFDLLQHPIKMEDISDYQILASESHKVFDDLNSSNADESFVEGVGHIHESSHRDMYYFTRITCRFLHLAIQLQRSDIVRALLNEYQVSPLTPLQCEHHIDETCYHEDMNGSCNEVIDERKRVEITPLELARRINHPEIIDQLERAINLQSCSVQSVTLISEASVDSLSENNDNDAATQIEREEEMLATSQRKKTRLILGDGNFSYSRGLAAKRAIHGQNNFSESLVVTEFNSEASLKAIYAAPGTGEDFRNFEENMDYLREKGAEIHFNIDASSVDRDFSGRHFERVHFNFPYFHDSDLSPRKNKAETKKLIAKFFESVSKIQRPGDRIHMALATGFARDPVWYEDATYGVQICEQWGYAYINKRNFVDPEKGARYPGYCHVKTSADTHVTTAEKGREFIFEKKIPGKNYEPSSETRCTTRGVRVPVLRRMATDSDTSSYDSDNESGNFAADLTQDFEKEILVEKPKSAAAVLGRSLKRLFSTLEEEKNNETEVQSSDNRGTFTISPPL